MKTAPLDQCPDISRPNSLKNGVRRDRKSNINPPSKTNIQILADPGQYQFLSFYNLLLHCQRLLLIVQPLLLARDESLQEFSLSFLQVANFLQ